MNQVGELGLLSNMVKSINESIRKLGVNNIENKIKNEKMDCDASRLHLSHSKWL